MNCLIPDIEVLSIAISFSRESLFFSQRNLCVILVVMKNKYSLLVIFALALLAGCDANVSSNRAAADSPSQEIPFKYEGTFVWEGESEIGYGLKVNDILTIVIKSDGKAYGTEFTKETNETVRWELQWFKDEAGDIVFGKFADANPNSNSKGAQFIGYPEGQDLVIGVNKRRYSRVK